MTEKRTKLKRILALVMALVMLTSVLAGCGERKEEQQEKTPEFVYVPKYTELDAEVQWVQNSCIAGDYLYLVAEVVDGTESYSDPETGESWEYDTYRMVFLRAKLDGTEIVELEGFYNTEDTEEPAASSYINGMFADKDGNVWVAEELYSGYYDLPEDFDPETDEEWNYEYIDESTVWLHRLDENGAKAESIDLMQYVEQKPNEYYYISGVQVDDEGNIFFQDGMNRLYVIGADGNLSFTLEVENYIGNIFDLGGGKMGATTYTDTGMVMLPIDMETKSWGEAVNMPYSAWNIYPGGGEYDLYYTQSISLYGFDVETGESTEVLNWIDCDIDSNNLNNVIILDDGTIICTCTYWNDDGNVFELATLEKVPYESVPQKKTLTLACAYVDYTLRGEIIKFNKTNPNYRITVNDYSVYNTQEDYNAGITKLATEIISGKVPDIIHTGSLPVAQYAASGLLEDLWPFIDADTELGGRDALVTQLFDALTTDDGKLYELASGFSISTVIAPTPIVGDKMGWTLDELYAALESLPEGAEVFGQTTTASEVLAACCSMGLDSFVDWESGKCSFDSQEFIDILEFTKLFPQEFDYDSFDWELDYESEYSRFQNGKQLCVRYTLGDFRDFQMYEGMLGGEITFVGMPTQNGSGSAFSVDGGLAMTTKCSDKAGAWEFMRMLLTEEYQSEWSYWGMPTNKAIFDARLEEVMTPIYMEDENGELILDENGEPIEQSQGGWGYDEFYMEMYAMNEEQAAQIMELINSVDSIYRYDESIYDIITNETELFYAGQKSAADTAAIIQSRVQIYVNQQK